MYTAVKSFAKVVKLLETKYKNLLFVFRTLLHMKNNVLLLFFVYGVVWRFTDSTCITQQFTYQTDYIFVSEFFCSVAPGCQST